MQRGLEAVRREGLGLTGGWGEHVARVAAAETLTGRPELALLTVKAQDADAAARANAAALAGVPVVVVQNGLGGPRVLHDALPDSPLIGAASLIAAQFVTPGTVTVTGPNVTVLAADTASAAELRGAAGVLRRVAPVSIASDLVGLQWSKLVVNQLNAAAAVTGLPAQSALASPTLRAAIAAAMRETVLVARAAGVALSGLPGLTPGVVAMIRLAPPAVTGRFVTDRMVAGMGGVPNLGSTLQSIERGRPTEVDFLSGAVVAEGERFGVRTPINRRIVALVHEAAASHVFLLPDEAARRLLL